MSKEQEELEPGKTIWAELDLENLNNQEEELQLLEDNSDVETKELKTESEEDTDNSDEDEEDVVKKRPSRAQERIRQLIREKKEIAAQAKQLEERLNKASKESFNTKKSSVETMKTNYDATIAAKTRAAQEAFTTGDAAYIELQNELNALTLRRTALDSWNEEEPEEVKFEFKEDDSDSVDDDEDTFENRLAKSGVPKEGVNWIKKNPRFVNDASFQRFSVAINEELVAEGFDPNEADFYEELDTRLVNIGKKTAPTSVKKGPKKSNGPALQSDSQIVTRSDGKKVIKYTAEDVASAETLGVPLKEYMKQKIKINSRLDSGWSVI